MHRTRHSVVVGLVATVALVLAGCADDGGGTTEPDAEATDTVAEEPSETAADTPTDDAGSDDVVEDETDETVEDETDEPDDGATAASATVAVASTELGDVVVDGDGRTLYMFVPDEGGEPTCTDDCAAVWPVFEGPAEAGDGADAALLSTATHPSGVTQVTYGGWPLYHFANDAAPGDVNGQGVNDVWFVVGPDGEPIRDDVSAAGVGY